MKRNILFGILLVALVITGCGTGTSTSSEATSVTVPTKEPELETAFSRIVLRISDQPVVERYWGQVTYFSTASCRRVLAREAYLEGNDGWQETVYVHFEEGKEGETPLVSEKYTSLRQALGMIKFVHECTDGRFEVKLQ